MDRPLPTPLQDDPLEPLGALLRADDHFDLRATRALSALLSGVVEEARRVRRRGGSREALLPAAHYKALLSRLLEIELEEVVYTPERLEQLGVKKALYLSRDRLEAASRLRGEQRDAELSRWRDSRLNRVDKVWFVRAAGKMPEQEMLSGDAVLPEASAEPPGLAAEGVDFNALRALLLLHNSPTLRPAPPPPGEVARKRWRELAEEDLAAAVTSAALELSDYPALQEEAEALQEALWQVHYQAARGGESWPCLLHPLGAGGAARASARVACWMVYGALLAENTRDAGARTISLLSSWGYRLKLDSVSPYYSRIRKDIERAIGAERDP